MQDTLLVKRSICPSELDSDDYKCYKFEIEISAKVKGYVYAHSEEEARKYVEEGKNDDIDDIYERQVENILDIRETKENLF